jgi:hypothetical protein
LSEIRGPASVKKVEVCDATTDDTEAAEAEEAGAPVLREFVLVLRVCAETKAHNERLKGDDEESHVDTH